MTSNLEHAVQFFNNAVRVIETDKNLAFKFLLSAVETAPDFSTAWFQIGNLLADIGMRSSAVSCLRRATEYEPNNSAHWTNLGHVLYHQGDIKEARAATVKAIELVPTNANAWMNLSLVQSLDGEVDESIASAKKAFELDKNPTTEMTLAFAYLHKRELALGLKHFEAKLPYKLPQYLNFPWPRWRGEDIRDKTLFIIADQGLGDTLCFMRFVPAAAQRCGHVILQIQSEMMRLAQLMLMDYPNIEVLPLNAPLPSCDTWVANTSLPVALGLTSMEIEAADLPPIPIEREPDPQWKTPGRKLHVAISWAGSPGNDIDRHRSMSVEPFLALSKVPGIQIYSMQKNGREGDLNNIGASAMIKDLAPWIHDVYDSAVMMQHIDLVISIESFLPHLASALKKECWILYSRDGKDWRVGQKGQRMVWHHNARLFHQDKTLSWGPTFDKIVDALKARLA